MGDGTVMGRIRDLYIAKKLAGGGGGSSYTLLHSEEIAASTTSTTATDLTTITIDDEGCTGDKTLLVRIRDKAGPRTGYFYGSYNYLLNDLAANGTGSGYAKFLTNAIGFDSNNKAKLGQAAGGSGSGVFTSNLNVGTKKITIRTKYDSTYGTIDGTFIVEVYLLDTPDGNPLFPSIS